MNVGTELRVSCRTVGSLIRGALWLITEVSDSGFRARPKNGGRDYPFSSKVAEQFFSVVDMQYKKFDENKDFFESHDFISSFSSNPKECWWLVGWFFGKGEGSLEYHDPVHRCGKDKYVRGATRHVIFRNPHYPGLDLLVGEFFDTYRKGWIQINNDGAFEFFYGTVIVPAEYSDYYEEGKVGRIIS